MTILLSEVSAGCRVCQDDLYIQDKDDDPTYSVTCVQYPAGAYPFLRLLWRTRTVAPCDAHCSGQPTGLHLLGCRPDRRARWDWRFPRSTSASLPTCATACSSKYRALEELTGVDYSHVSLGQSSLGCLLEPVDGLAGEQRIIRHAVDKNVARVPQSVEAFVRSYASRYPRGRGDHCGIPVHPLRYGFFRRCT